VLERLASLDPLTHLYGRQPFEALGRQVLDGIGGQPVSVVCAAVDGFEDLAGRDGAAANRALVEVAALILTCVRELDIAGRYGAGTFTVLLPEASLEDARRVGDRIRERVADRGLRAGGRVVSVSACAAELAVEDWSQPDPLLALLHRAGDDLRARTRPDAERPSA